MMTTNAILNLGSDITMMPVPQEKWWEAVLARDTNQDGQFFFAVSTTGVITAVHPAGKAPAP